ncbi:FAD-dependent oxidoreductase [Rhodococcus sp. D2-41]|uniref:ferredoxin--NADP(+) reductase n=1 Tax=Speluncibacter jeojiensis TaxID=2710754 RepID=A0A9X4RFB7_9ACTN|nr:FAD-dependent oxidoreductase [Rhodococcus sp. D2-41]MDG3009209.1 FAD-dependent oxidoreductase [Rhodococcus sp. D2-41]MDG3016117.1 FAD-dependent oxidoreductase [Corynebacteriales bacterium D3-21]
MAYVITQACCNDASCVEVCPVDCIRPTPDDPEYATTEMLYIEPGTCIDCGACVDACPVDAIFPEDQLSAANARYQTINAEYFEKHPLKSSWDSFEPMVPVAVPKDEAPLRVAIVGSGPAACYAAADLITQGGNSVEVEMFDRLPTPWGLVRAGVAPDHPGTKAVTDVFRWTVSKPSFEFHLNVEIGKHLTHDELMAHHHAVIYAVGAAGDRRLGVPGEDLPGSHAATEFVAWYNGHPDYADLQFDLSAERAVIVGNGNVALDVARVLVMDPADLAGTDIAEHALEALRKSNIREVVVLGRRGPAQAAYTNPEFIALGHLDGVDVVVDPAEVVLDDLSQALVDAPDAEPSVVLKTRLAQEYSERTPNPANKRIVLRYLASPTEVLGDDHVTGITVAHNELVEQDGALRARATDRTETIETGLLLRSVGYRGTPVPGIPFDERRGTIPNEGGRVVDPETGEPVAGVYTAGWIKRGPSGVIGTNKKCAKDTVALLFQDFKDKKLVRPIGDRKALDKLVHERQPEVVDYKGWEAIDKAERERGKEAGRPRTKITDVKSMIEIARH